MADIVAVSYGMGVNSKALIAELVQRETQIDVIQAADTRGEKPKTYLDLFAFDDWLYERGVRAPVPMTWTRPPHPHYAVITELPDKRDIRAVQLVIKRSPRKGYVSLEDNCVRTGWLPSRAYGLSSCAQKWKHDPMHYFLRHWEPSLAVWKAGGKILKYIGIDAGEAHRAKPDEDDLYRYRYPLVEWGWAREECVERLQTAELPVPPKSACYFCPSSKKAEVLALAKEYPSLFGAAVKMERGAKEAGRSRVDGLGRHFSWEELVKAKDPAAFPEAITQDCMCSDGNADD